MLPRSERLGTTAFATAFARSRTFHHALVAMRVHRRQKTESAQGKGASCKPRARVAFVVAKKLGRATVRNRMRRRLREAYRLSEARNALALQSLDIIFLVKTSAFEASFEELCAAMDEILGRLDARKLDT